MQNSKSLILCPLQTLHRPGNLPQRGRHYAQVGYYTHAQRKVNYIKIYLEGYILAFFDSFGEGYRFLCRCWNYFWWSFTICLNNYHIPAQFIRFWLNSRFTYNPVGKMHNTIIGRTLLVGLVQLLAMIWKQDKARETKVNVSNLLTNGTQYLHWH